MIFLPMRARRARILAVLTVALLVVALLAWARSYLPLSHCDVYAYRGRLVVIFADKLYPFSDPSSPSFPGVSQMIQTFENVSPPKSLLGVQLMSETLDPPNWYFIVAIPFPYVVLPLAVLAWLSVRSAREASRRTREKRCPSCGYDLRASPERCPECGGANPFITKPLSTP